MAAILLRASVGSLFQHKNEWLTNGKSKNEGRYALSGFVFAGKCFVCAKYKSGLFRRKKTGIVQVIVLFCNADNRTDRGGEDLERISTG